MVFQLSCKLFLKVDTVGASAVCAGSRFNGSVERTATVAFRMAKAKSGWRALKLCPGEVHVAGASKNSSVNKF